jgi:orotidine-5'-phosphate decarboxylase
MFIDELIDKIREKNNPTVVGLDPQVYLIPKCILESFINNEEGMGEVFWQFNRVVIDAIGDLVPAVKLQIAFYEQWGIEGLRAYQKTIKYAKEKGLMVIGDIKRGDISSTAKAYASAHLKGPFECDSVTINPLLGWDSIEPFASICKNDNKGIFVLVKTSNSSSGELQNLMSQEKPIYMHLAQSVKTWGEELVGKYGYSSIGAVVAATYPGEAKRLRKEMPNTFFLVPGFGAQGGKAKDIVHSFDSRGLGAIVNSSRGILGAYIEEEGENISLETFKDSLIKATIKMKKELLEALKE